jgi:hypothetical protein
MDEILAHAKKLKPIALELNLREHEERTARLEPWRLGTPEGKPPLRDLG